MYRERGALHSCRSGWMLAVLCGGWASLVAVRASEQDASEALMNDLPVVLSPTHLVQPLGDSPVAVTVIDRAQIRAMGAREIPELLRRVAGVVVAHESNLAPVVGYHGLNGGYMHRMQVLVDGRSVYDPVFGGTHWSTLPLEVEDIERIEFVRGPNAATDGANAFLATVSITTRQASEDRGAVLQARYGNGGVRDIYGRYGGGGEHFDYRLSAAYREDEGVENRLDDKQVRYVAGRLDARPAAAVHVTAQAGYKTGRYGYGFDERTAPLFGLCIPPHTRPIEDGYIQFRLEHNPNAAEQTLVQFYVTQLDASSSYRRTPLCGGFLDERSYKVRRYDAEMRRSWSPSDATRLIVGASARLDRVDADDRISGFPGSPWSNDPENRHERLYANWEFRPSERWLLNLGTMLEHHTLTDEVHWSPRLAVNYRLDARQTLRFGISRAVRVPGFLEETWRNDLWDQPGGLRAETLVNREIGYLGVFPDWGLTVDLRVFHDRARNLLNALVSQFPLRTVNEGSASSVGFEAQTRWRIAPDTDVRFAYAYNDIDSDNPFGVRYTESAPRHIADVFVTHEFDDRLTGSVGFNYAGGMFWLEGGSRVPPTRYLDLRLARRLDLAGADGSLALVIRNLLDDQVSYHERTTVGREIYLTLELPF